MKKHISLILLALLCCSGSVWAQRRMKQMDSEKQEQEDKAKEYESEPWYDKLRFGGNIGASFGSGYTAVMLQPMAFYQLREKTMVGAGVTYYYWSYKVILNNGQTKNISDNAYGFNLFSRQVLFDPIFAHVEWNPMNYTFYDRLNGEEKRIWKSSLFLGGGIQQTAGRGGFYLLFLYDVLWDKNKSFSPIPYDIRMGFYF